jgi:hypothetical protein
LRRRNMFIQVIRGKGADPDGARRQLERWSTELRPGAAGFLGSTAGVTPGGEMIVLARFESADLARRNSDRPEQGEWWNEMAKTFEGEVTFKDSSDVDVMMGGGSDDAGFVQIMIGTVADRAKVRALQPEIERAVREARPEALGATIAWHDDGTFTQAVYFTSEAAAREMETRPMPPVFAEVRAAAPVSEFFDLPKPWLW